MHYLIDLRPNTKFLIVKHKKKLAFINVAKNEQSLER